MNKKFSTEVVRKMCTFQKNCLHSVKRKNIYGWKISSKIVMKTNADSFYTNCQVGSFLINQCYH